MSRFAMMLAAFALVGCGGGDKEDSGGTSGDGGAGDGGDGGGCDVTFALSNPAADSTTHFYLDPVEVTLSTADATASLSIADAAGTAVAGSTSFSADGLTAIFTPDAGFAPSTAYTVNISVCDGGTNSSAGFTTSALGGPVTVDLSGTTYVVNLAESRFVQPAGVADLLLGSLENNILVGVRSATDTSIEMIGAIDDAGSGAQDYCTPSIPFPTATFNNPAFQVGPADTTLNVAGVSITINGLSISGAFAADGSYFGGGRLEGQLDARTLAPLLGDLLGVTDPDEVCGLLIGFGVTCGACDSDGAAYCVDVLADQITATAQGAELVCVDESDCHPECASSTCDDTSAGEC